MASPARMRSTTRAARTIRAAAVLLGLALAVAGAVSLAASPASAQGFGWFGNLFGGAPRPSPGTPAYPGYGQGAPRSSPYDAPRRRAPRHRTADQPLRDAPKDAARDAVKDAARDAVKDKTPKNASLFVYVFGDSLGQMLANGLDDSLADRADVAVVHRARGSTGLVATDFYDWPRAIDEMLARPAETAKPADGASDPAKTAAKPDPGSATKPERIDVAVMMIGSNDRQPIVESGKTLDMGTPAWTAAYRQRVVAIDEAFHRKRIPLVWVGIPITKDDTFADDMAALNDIYREVAAQDGATYVDTWEAFSDENGDFSAYGPDINGQTARLRSADGVHFTKAGARKLAHFVDVHIRRALDGKSPAPELPTADQGQKDAGKPVAAAKPESGPIKNLNETPVSRNGELDTIGGGAEPVRDTLVDATIVKGRPTTAPTGRADDQQWPAHPSTP